MEDMKKQQLEVLEEAKDYCQKVLHCIDTVIPELKGDKKDDTDEYLRMTVDAVNNTLEMYNATRSLVQEHSDIDEAEVNAAVSTLGTALKSGVDDAKADALDGMKNSYRLMVRQLRISLLRNYVCNDGLCLSFVSFYSVLCIRRG